MRGTAYDSPVVWLEFQDPDDEDQIWRVHASFLLSNWRCLFGQGCPGHYGLASKHTYPDMGCCGHGAYISSRQNLKQIERQVKKLRKEDVGPEGLAYIKKNGWQVKFTTKPDKVDPDYINVKTKVRDGGCVFAKRIGDGDDRSGCAFVLMGQRLGMEDHIDVMPEVCWQLPLGSVHTRDKRTDKVLTEIVPWDAQYWGGEDEDGTHDSWMSWWCVDTPDAYSGPNPLYVTMERELRRMMGDGAYDVMAAQLKEMVGTWVPPMSGAVQNEGRPMLPLLIGNRSPKRMRTRSADVDATDTEAGTATGPGQTDPQATATVGVDRP